MRLKLYFYATTKNPLNIKYKEEKIILDSVLPPTMSYKEYSHYQVFKLLPN